MNKNRVADSAKEAKGELTNAIGKLTADARLQADGKADKSKGKLQNTTAGAKAALKN